MKKIVEFFLFLIACLLAINCSNEDFYLPSENDNNKDIMNTPDEGLNIPNENENIQDVESGNSWDINTPIDSLTNIGAVEIEGLPKTLKVYEDGILKYWAQYYFRPDGNILKVNYGYSSSSSEMFSDIYLYDSEGKLTKLNGHDIYDFYWSQERIVEAHRYNGMWYGRSNIFYKYNNSGQLAEKLENNIDFNFQVKTRYAYSEEGNLKSIEEYGDYNGSGVFTIYVQTNFNDYGSDLNLFPEVQIIPGLSAQSHFPSSMEIKYLTASYNNRYETYNYEYNADGKVAKKIYGKNMVVYDYY